MQRFLSHCTFFRKAIQKNVIFLTLDGAKELKKLMATSVVEF